MADVLDIIAKLSLEVSDADLDKHVAKLQNAARIIDDLKKREDNLALARKSANSAFEYDKITADIAKNRKEIDLRTAALQKTFAEDKKLQAALNEEIGIIHRLTDLMKRLKEERTAATDPKEIAALTQSITQIQGEIKRLVTPNKGGNEIFPTFEIKREIGLLEQLDFKLKQIRNSKQLISKEGDLSVINREEQLTIARINQLKETGVQKEGPNILSQVLGFSGGEGSIGRQVLGGVFRGLAIGSGFGIITRLTDELIQYGITLYDTQKRNEELLKSNEGLEKSFQSLGEELAKEVQDLITLNNIEYGGINNSVEGYKRKIEAIKAAGVERDKQVAFDKKVLQAENDERTKQLTDVLQPQQQQLQNIADLYKEAKKQTEDYFNSPEVKALSANGDPSKNKNVQYDVFNKLLRSVNKSNIPDDIKTKFVTQLNSGYAEGANLLDVLTKETRVYGIELNKVTQSIEDNKTATENANTAFTAKQVQAQYKLQVSLLRELRKEQEEYSVAILKDVFDTSKIKQDAELKELAITKQREKDEHGLSLANLEAYEQKRKSIERKYALEREEFILKQEAFFKDLSISILQSSIQTGGELLKLDVAPAADDFIQIAKQKNELLDKEQQKFADKLRSDANGNRELEIKAEEEISHKKELIVIEQNNNIIDSYKQFYTRLSQIITEQENSILIKQGLSTSERADALSSRYAKYRISEALYRNLQQQVTLQAAIQTDKTKFGGTAQQLTAAISTQQNIINDPKSTGKQIQDAKNQIELLQTELNNLDKDINEKSRNLHQLRIESIFIEIDAYKQLVDSAVSAYSAINAAHQKYLEAEISIQGERVREAEVLANRGNTTALKQQQETLNKLEQQKELYARREMVVNSALALSNAVLAIAKAAAEGGGFFSIATIAATIAALTAGYAAVSNLNSPLSQPGFAKGGYTGDGGKNDTAGVVHKGEFVFNKETTAKYRPMFEAIHKYGGVPVMNEVFASGNKKTDDSIVRKLDEVTDAIKENRVRFGMHVDKSGFGLHVEEMIRANNNRFR